MLCLIDSCQNKVLELMEVTCFRVFLFATHSGFPLDSSSPGAGSQLKDCIFRWMRLFPFQSWNSWKLPVLEIHLETDRDIWWMLSRPFLHIKLDTLDIYWKSIILQTVRKYARSGRGEGRGGGAGGRDFSGKALMNRASILKGRLPSLTFALSKQSYGQMISGFS